MEELSEQKERIKEYVLLINSTLEEDDDLLDYTIDSVVEKALIYMNRLQLDNEQITEFYRDDEVVPPILPTELERVLAEVVVGAYRNITSLNEQGKEVHSISDNGQSITYSEQMASYLNGSETEVFSSSLKHLQKYRLPTILAPTY